MSLADYAVLAPVVLPCLLVFLVGWYAAGRAREGK